MKILDWIKRQYVLRFTSPKRNGAVQDDKEVRAELKTLQEALHVQKNASRKLIESFKADFTEARRRRYNAENELKDLKIKYEVFELNAKHVPTLTEISKEWRTAEDKFSAFHGPRDGFDILDEEVQELKRAIRHGTPEEAMKEAIQVAAMACRLIYEVYDPEVVPF